MFDIVMKKVVLRCQVERKIQFMQIHVSFLEQWAIWNNALQAKHAIQFSLQQKYIY